MDKYDKQIARLKNDPNNIYDEWREGEGLFKIIGDLNQAHNCGCLIQIRRDTFFKARVNNRVNYKLTDAIRNDKRIPCDPHNINKNNLRVFAYWQRKIDKLCS